MEAALYSFFCLSLSALHAVGKALISSLNESKEVGGPEKESIQAFSLQPRADAIISLVKGSVEKDLIIHYKV